MSNPYYTFDTPLTPGTRGRAGELNDQFLAIQTGFDNIPGPGGASFAAPTVKVGLTADIGVLNTALRSDAQLALNQGIAPAWTGQHSYTTALAGLAGPVRIMSATPGFLLQETDVAADNGWWRNYANSATLRWDVSNDANSITNTWMAVARTGVTVDSIALTSTALTWNGAQLATLGGNGFTGNMSITNAAPEYGLIESDAGAGNKRWQMWASGETFGLAVVTDAGTASNFFAVDRTGQTIDSIAFNAGLLTFSTGQEFRIIDNEAYFSGFAAGGLIRTGYVQFANTSTGITLESEVAGRRIALITAGGGPILLNGVNVTDYARLSSTNTFTLGQVFSSANPGFRFTETDASANNKNWYFDANGEQLRFYMESDVFAAANWMTVDRTGNTCDAINLITTALTWNGTQLATLGLNTFTQGQTISTAGGAFLSLRDPSAATNEKNYRVQSDAGQFRIIVDNDAGAGVSAPVVIDRTGTTVDSIALTSTALTWNGNALPTLVASNVFTGTAQTLTRTDPSFRWSDTGASSGARAYAIQATGGSQFFQLFNDAFSSGTSWMSVQRSGNTATFINLTSTNLLWNGSPLALSGTYTPTLNNSLNIAASTSAVCNYIQVGSVVTVSGSVLVTPQNGTGQDTQLGLSLPIASAFATGAEAGGAGRHNNSAVGVVADTANDRALLEWFAGTTSSTRLDFTFTYRIV